MTDQPSTPLQDALDKIGPDDHVTVIVVHTEHGDSGASLEAQKDIGKPGGWSASGLAQVMRNAGWAVAAAFKWKPRA